MSSRTKSHSQDEGQVAVEERVPDLKEPPKYAVMLHNDNYTTMEFVVEVLEKFFQKNKEEAVKVMLAVHSQGKGVAGIYSLEVAETKSVQVVELAKARGFPLKCTLEPVE